MTGLEFMHNIKQIRRRIRLLEEQIQRDTILAQGVGAIRYDKDHVQTSPVQDRMTDIVATIIETTEQLKIEISKLQNAELKARVMLIQLSEEHERVLTYHYLEDLSWLNVANKMGYNDNYIYEIKDKALLELDKVLNESEQI